MEMIKQLEEVLARLKGNLTKEEVGGVHSSGYKLTHDTINSDQNAKLRIGQHYDTGEAVAIKIFKRTALHSDQEIGRLLKEVKLQARLDHYHIAYLYEVSTAQADHRGVGQHLFHRRVLSQWQPAKRYRESTTALRPVCGQTFLAAYDCCRLPPQRRSGASRHQPS